MLTTALDQFKIGVDGWKNSLIKDDAIEQLAQRRNEICLLCEHKKALTCGLCGCPLVAKQRARDASCPDQLW